MMNIEPVDKTQEILDKHFEKFWQYFENIPSLLETISNDTCKIMARAAYVHGIYESPEIREEMQLSTKATEVETKI